MFRIMLQTTYLSGCDYDQSLIFINIEVSVMESPVRDQKLPLGGEVDL
jgi:hypothetical protein